LSVHELSTAHHVTFDVICVGEVTWKLAMSERPASGPRAALAHLRPSGGPMNIALQLRSQGLRVGLAAVLPDDTRGRTAYARLAEHGVDISGVTFARARPGLVVVDARGDANELFAALEETPPFELPRGWSSQLLLLSGLSPVVSHAAALCRAARRARRDGSLVLIDFNAALNVWAGRDARTIRMVLREVDVARCSIADLAVLGMERESVRAALRPDATFVVSEPDGRVSATGPFGEVTASRATSSDARRMAFRAGAGDALTASLCAALTAKAEKTESAASMWDRVLRRGY
jgi:sugar/nucleoside kinase (ribokinase family)